MLNRRKTSLVILAAMLVVFAALVLALLKQKCLFVDDSQHIPAGYSYLVTRDFRLNQEHPPLIKLVSALGLIALKPQLPLDSPGWEKAAEPGDPDDGSSEFAPAFFARNAERFAAIAFWGRVPVVVVPLLLAVAVWWFARTLFGELAGILAALLLLSEPNIIGNATLVQDDLAAALMLLVFVISLRHYFKQPTLRRAALLGSVLGLALLTKYSLVVLAPVCLLAMMAHAILLFARRRWPAGRRPELPIIVTMLCAYLILIAGYAFRVDWIDEDEAAMAAEWLHLSGHFSESFQALLLHLPVMLPKYFLSGIEIVLQGTHGGRPAFLLGEVSSRGWRYYFPVAFALKTTLPFLLVTVGGLAWSIWRIVRRRWLDGLYVVLPPLLYLALSMTSHLNIGVRHALPIFPFFAIAGAGALAAITRRALWRGLQWGHLIVTAALVWSVALAALSYPNYLTHFNVLAGGPADGREPLSEFHAETRAERNRLAHQLKQNVSNKVPALCIGVDFLRYYDI